VFKIFIFLFEFVLSIEMTDSSFES